MGSFIVKFEEWFPELHAYQKLISSYGGWLKFRGIPLHAWNIDVFKQIGEACGGFENVGRRNTWLKLDLTEAWIRVKDNYCGFVLALNYITDEQGRSYPITTVTLANGKWFTSKHPKIHGSFKRDVEVNFIPDDPMSECFFFQGAASPPTQNIPQRQDEKSFHEQEEMDRKGRQKVLEERTILTLKEKSFLRDLKR